MSELKQKPRWVYKTKAYFQLLDVNRKGYITKEDWCGIVGRLVEKTGLAPDHPKVTAYHSALSQFYDELCCGKEKLTEEEYVECASSYFPQQAALRRTQPATATQTLIVTAFQALDASSNGYLSPKDWEVLFFMYKYPEFETMAAEAFKAVDKNKDGKISPEEFLQYGYEFWLSDEDEHDVQSLYGPKFQLSK